MSLTETQHKTKAPMALETIWLEIENRLEQKKVQVQDEIANYPPPVPACDVQFNHLLEERSRVALELNRMRAVSEKDANFRDSIHLLREFIRSSAVMDDAMKATWESKVSRLSKEI